jgi:hypothetical protein
MAERRANRFMIERQVQSALLWRVAAYWVYCLIALGVMLIFWNAMTGPPRRGVELLADVLARYTPAMLASVVLLPLVMIDVLKLSHRFVGPVGKLRQGLAQLAAGRRPERMSFRKGDFWPEMAEEFNRAAARIDEAGAGLAPSPTSGQT